MALCRRADMLALVVTLVIALVCTLAVTRVIAPVIALVSAGMVRSLRIHWFSSIRAARSRA